MRLWDVRDGQKIVVTCACGQIAHDARVEAGAGVGVLHRGALGVAQSQHGFERGTHSPGDCFDRNRLLSREVKLVVVLITFLVDSPADIHGKRNGNC